MYYVFETGAVYEPIDGLSEEIVEEARKRVVKVMDLRDGVVWRSKPGPKNDDPLGEWRELWEEDK